VALLLLTGQGLLARLSAVNGSLMALLLVTDDVLELALLVLVVVVVLLMSTDSRGTQTPCR
jgi:hypothetical protein